MNHIAPHAITLTDLTLVYDRIPAVHHLSGIFAPGSMTAVVGPNGGGKSTLLKAIAGLMRPSEGHVDLGSLVRGDIAYLPQRAEIDTSFPINVHDTVALGLWQKTGLFGGIHHEGTYRVDAALGAVGLAKAMLQPIGSLSAGQLQRVLFARLLLQDASIILLDEPFAAVDAGTTADLLALINHWHHEGRTVIAVLHDMAQAEVHFSEALMLSRELIGWGPTADILTNKYLAHAQRLSMGQRTSHADEHPRGSTA